MTNINKEKIDGTSIADRAIHEAGHAVVAMVLKVPVLSLNIMHCQTISNPIPQEHAAMILHAGYCAQVIRFRFRDPRVTMLSGMMSDLHELKSLQLNFDVNIELYTSKILKENWAIVEGLAAILECDRVVSKKVLVECFNKIQKQSI